MKVGDVNGDGTPDLVVADTSVDTVSVLLGNGDGTFQLPQTFATGSQPTAVTLGDMNGDGKLDVAVANVQNNSVSVLLGNGDGTFQTAKTFATGSYQTSPSSVALGDVNGDGTLDLVVASFTSGTVSVLMGTRDGTFTSPQTLATGNAPFSVALGDVNGDGKLDLAVTNIGDNTVTVLLGNGDGTFGAQQTFATGHGPFSLALGDVNGDGTLDLAVTNESSNTVSVLLGNGDGTFAAQQTFATGHGPFSLALGDMDGDGRPDLAVANTYSGTVSVRLNNNSPRVGVVFTLVVPTTVTSVVTSGSGVTSGTGDLNAGKTVTLTVNFDSAVTVDTTGGSPTLSLNDGATAVYTGGTGTTALTFNYTVSAGENTSDLAVTAFNLNGATIATDGINSSLTGAVTNPAGTLQIDTTTPTATIALVGSTTVAAQSSLQFAVAFSEPVTGVDATGFSLVTTGVTGASLCSVVPGADSAHYIVTVNSGTGDGTIGLNVTGTGIADLAANAAAPQTGPLYTLVKSIPTATVNPVNITYGTLLADQQLSGSASVIIGGTLVVVPGAFTFTTAGNTKLTAGDGQIVSVTFTPTDTVDFNSVTTKVTVNVAKFVLTISAACSNKVYDGTAFDSATLSDNRVAGDIFEDTYTSAHFTDQNSASDKTVTVSGISISGVDAGNYTFNSSAVTTANITSAPLTITPVYNTKVFDNTTAANATPTVSGLQGSDTVTGLTEAYLSAVALGNNKNTLIVTGYTINDGNGGNNYTVTANTALGTITKTASKLVFLTPLTATGIAGAALTPSLSVALEDSASNIVDSNNTSSVALSLATGPVGAVFDSASTLSMVVSNGIANFSNLILDSTGKYKFAATDAPLTKATSGAVTINPAAPSQLVIQQNPTSGTAGVALAPAVKVLVKDSFGNVVTSPTTVTLTLDHGTFSTGKVTATANTSGGVATFSNLMINVAGDYTLTVSDAATPASIQSFDVSIVPNVATKLAYVQQPSGNGIAGIALDSVDLVAVEDKFGNVITSDSSSSVTLTLSSGAFSNGSKTISANVSSGIATFGSPNGPDLIINKSGKYTLKATDAALTSVISNPVLIAPAATRQIVFQTIPSKATTAGTPLVSTIKVLLEDGFGNIASGDNSDVTLSIVTGPAGGVFEGGSTLTVAAQNGVATFSNLILDTSGKYTLNADGESLPTVTSGVITINPAVAAKLVFQNPLPGGTVGAALNPAVTVAVEDSFGNLVTSATSVTLTIASGPVGGSFSTGSIVTVNSANGIATFRTLKFKTAGVYTLLASAGTLAKETSASFVIS